MRWLIGILILVAPPIVASPDPYPAPVAINLEGVFAGANDSMVRLHVRWDADWNGTISVKPSEGVSLSQQAWTVSGRAGDRRFLDLEADVPENKFWNIWATYPTMSRSNSASLYGWGGPPVLTDITGHHLLGQLGDPGLQVTMGPRGDYERARSDDTMEEGVILDVRVVASAPWTDTCTKRLLNKDDEPRFVAPKGEVTTVQYQPALYCPQYIQRYYGPFDLVIDRTGDEARIQYEPEPFETPTSVKAPSPVAMAPLLLALFWHRRKPG